MGFLNKLLGKSQLASEKQIEYLKSLGNKATDKQFADVLRANGHNSTDGPSTILANLTEDQASALIDTFLNIERITDGQIRFLVMMWRDMSDMNLMGNKTSDATIDAYWKTHELLSPYFSDADLDAGAYDMEWKVLSKRQATVLISTIEPVYDEISETGA